MQNLKKKIKRKENELIYKAETLTENKLIVTMGKELVRDRLWVWDWPLHIIIVKIDNQTWPTV